MFLPSETCLPQAQELELHTPMLSLWWNQELFVVSSMFSPTCLKMVSTLGVCGICFLMRYWTWPLLYLGFPSLLSHKELVSFKYTNNLLSSYKGGGILLVSWITERKVKYGAWPLGINNLNRWKDTSRDNSCYIKTILYAKCCTRGLIESKANMVQS